MGYAKMNEESIENDRFDSWEYYRNMPADDEVTCTRRVVRGDPPEGPLTSRAPFSSDSLASDHPKSAQIRPRE